MAIVSIKSAKPGEDVEVTLREGKGDRKLRMHTRNLQGILHADITATMRSREINVPRDIFYNHEIDGSVSVAAGIEPDWEADRIGRLAENKRSVDLG